MVSDYLYDFANVVSECKCCFFSQMLFFLPQKLTDYNFFYLKFDSSNVDFFILFTQMSTFLKDLTNVDFSTILFINHILIKFSRYLDFSISWKIITTNPSHFYFFYNWKIKLFSFVFKQKSKSLFRHIECTLDSEETVRLITVRSFWDQDSTATKALLVRSYSSTRWVEPCITNKCIFQILVQDFGIQYNFC